MSKNRALGKSSSKLLVTLAERDKTVFTFKDAREVLGTTDAATRKLLSTLMAKKWIIVLNRGRYLVVPLSAGERAEVSENWYVVAKYLVAPRPYYISYYSAMELHQMTTQPLSTVYVCTPHRKNNATALGATFRFVYLNPARLWGTTEVWATTTEKVVVSDLERTILDCLERPDLCGGISEIARGLFSRRADIDYHTLLEYSKRFGNNAVMKRLAFLLELYELNTDTAEALRRSLNKSFALLDPSLPPRGVHRTRWHLRLNIDPDELKRNLET
jgi:predicted transcriptional regulator of viral defense system